MVRLVFLQRGGELIRAARAVAALDALQAADSLVNGHADDERGDALRIARAAAVEFAGGDDVTGPLTVVKAMKAGRIAAASMDEYMNK